MNWYDDVLDCAKRKNEIWFRRTNELILELTGEFNSKSRKAIVLWSLSMANDVRNKLSHHAFKDTRPKDAIDIATEWAFGRESMRNARRAIIDCHALCKEGFSERDNLYLHAIGQACSTVHTPKHVMGLPVYELTAVAKTYGLDNCKEAILDRIEFYKDKMKFCETQVDKYASWANFMVG